MGDVIKFRAKSKKVPKKKITYKSEPYVYYKPPIDKSLKTLLGENRSLERVNKSFAENIDFWKNLQTTNAKSIDILDEHVKILKYELSDIKSFSLFERIFNWPY